jgi:raffinose/stachyose/melibiose transport system substrate-binding protein
MSRISRRSLIVATGAAAAGLAAPSVRAQQATEITFWTWRQEDRTQYAQLFNTFRRTNPNVTMKYEAFPPEQYGTVLSTALAAGRGPDVVHVRAYGGLEQFARANYLAPLERADVPELANFSADALASTTLRADNKVYAIPFASQTLGLFINRQVFETAGVQVPENWDQLKQVCAALKARNIIPIANGMATAFMVEIFVSVFGASFYGKAFIDDMAAGRATFEDPRYVGALTRLLELREFLPQGFAAIDYPTMQQLFLSGRAAMFAGGSFEIANFRRQNPNLRMEFHAPPAAQAGGARLASLFYDGGYAVNARTDKRAPSLALVRWMGTKEFGDQFSSLLGNVSPIRGVVNNDAMLARVSELNATAVPHVMLVYFRYQEPTGSTLLQRGTQQMMNGEKTPQQLGAEITQGIATYHAPFRR